MEIVKENKSQSRPSQRRKSGADLEKRKSSFTESLSNLDLEIHGVRLPKFDIQPEYLELIDDPNSGINDVAQVIQTDPVLSGRLIQLANSVYFSGRSFTVTSLPRAIGRLGLKMALDIAYSVELPKLFAKVKQIDQELFGNTPWLWLFVHHL